MIIVKEESPNNNNGSESNGDLGIIGLWLDQVKQLGYSFSETEITAISEWASYKADKCQSISIKQIALTLEILVEHKTSHYDIAKMIKRSIANGYAGIMTPTKDFLIAGNKPTVITGRYPSLEYITPETKTQKIELRNYFSFTIKCVYLMEICFYLECLSCNKSCIY